MDRQRKLQDYFYPHVPEGQGKPGNFQITDAKGVGEFVFYSEGAGHSLQALQTTVKCLLE